MCVSEVFIASTLMPAPTSPRQPNASNNQKTLSLSLDQNYYEKQRRVRQTVKLVLDYRRESKGHQA
jgi:hypothetical protein